MLLLYFLATASGMMSDLLIAMISASSSSCSCKAPTGCNNHSKDSPRYFTFEEEVHITRRFLIRHLHDCNHQPKPGRLRVAIFCNVGRLTCEAVQRHKTLPHAPSSGSRSCIRVTESPSHLSSPSSESSSDFASVKHQCKAARAIRFSRTRE